MQLEEMFQSVMDADSAPIVLCDLTHKIVYMNPKAIRHYASWGGEKLLGCSLLDCHNAASRARIEQVLAWFAENKAHCRIHTVHVEKENKDIYMVALRDRAGNLIGYYEKHEYRTAEAAARYDFSRSLL